MFAGQPYRPAFPQHLGLVAGVTASDLDGDGVDDAVIDDGGVLLGGPGGLAFDRAYYNTGMLSVAVGNLTGNGPRDLVAQHDGAGYVLLPRLSGCLGELVPYGAGCPGSTGVVPVLSGEGCPTPAGSYALAVSGGLPSTVAYASFGLGQGSIPLPGGCTLLLDPWLPIFVGFMLDTAGQGSLGIAVSPVSPTGITVTTQVGLFDPGAPGFFTLTNGLSISVR